MPIELILFIDLAARSALILGCAWGVMKVAARLSAAARYWIWLTALCVLPLLLVTAELPVKSLIEITPKMAQPRPVRVPEPSAVDGPLAPTIAGVEIGQAVEAGAEPVIERPVFNEQLPPPSAMLTPAGPMFPSAFILVYLLGVAAVVLPIIVGVLRLQWLRRRAVSGHEIVGGFVLPSRTRVLVSGDISVPLTWGALFPTIALPVSARGWSRERLQVVLAHESAHIARHDFATGILASLLRAAFWFQPLAWLAVRRMRIEREVACDDRVLVSGTSAAPDYAEHLSELVKQSIGRAPATAIPMARPSEMVARVRAILDSARNRASLSGRAKGRIIVVALALFAPLAFVRCAGEKSASRQVHETGNGIELKSVDPSGITISRDGNTQKLAGGKAFSMAVKEVTQAQFEEVLGHNPSSTQAANLPVDRVTRTEAVSFCRVLSERDRRDGTLPKGKVYRLPTQLEWLLAAFPDGATPQGAALDAVAWHSGNSAGQLQPVGSKQSGANGLSDMLGNVAEWTDPDPGLAGEEGTDDGVARYAGRTRMQVNMPQMVVFDVRNTPDQAARQAFQMTQIEVMKSRAVLLDVVKELDLLARWKIATEDGAVEVLRSNLRIEVVRGTDLIDLTYFGNDPDEVIEIANAIGSSYSGRVEEGVKDQGGRVVDALEAQVRERQKLMEEARDTMLGLMQDSNIVDISGTTPKWMGGSLEKGSETIVMKSRPVEDAAKLEDFRKTQRALQNLEGDELIEAAVEVGLQNPTVANRYPEYKTAQLREKALLESGLGERHPEILQVQGSLSLLQKLLLDAIDSSRRSIATRLEMAEKAPLRAAGTDSPVLDEKRRSIAYLEAKNEYELQKSWLGELKRRAAIESVNLKVPRNQVTMHEKAVARKIAAAATGSALAIGGSAFDPRGNLVEGSRVSSSNDDRRTTGVGFRFVMADE